MFKGFALMRKTSSKKCWNLASWHSPHSLTWSWVLSVQLCSITWPKPYVRSNPSGVSAGFGQLASFCAYRTNSGWQLLVALFWIQLSFNQQRPMWYRHMYDSLEAENQSLKHQCRTLERERRHISPAAQG